MTTHSDFPPAYAKRLLSLDVFRGLTLAVMILVNNANGELSWPFLLHAQWNGLTLADLVFPSFLFAVGASIVYAFEARLLRGATRTSLAWHIVRRAMVLFVLGVVLNALPFDQFAHLRFYGVLQRVALCYLAVGLLYLLDRRLWTKLLLCGLLLVGYWALLRWVPVPGAGMPGRDVPFLDTQHNLASWLDRKLMTGHLYLPSEPPTYDRHDPEGLLSTLPAIASTLLGMIAAIGLRRRRTTTREKTRGLMAFAAITLLLGYTWSLTFPLNKNLWTSSYVLVSAGWSLATLALLHWLIEQRGWRKGWSWPWLVFGSNSIVCYVFSELLGGVLRSIPITYDGNPTSLGNAFFDLLLRTSPSPGWASFLLAFSFAGLSFLPVWLLWNRRIFVKI